MNQLLYFYIHVIVNMKSHGGLRYCHMTYIPNPRRVSRPSNNLFVYCAAEFLCSSDHYKQQNAANAESSLIHVQHMDQYNYELIKQVLVGLLCNCNNVGSNLGVS